MKTAELQAEVAKTGNHMRREMYAGTCPRSGRLVSRYRWTVQTKDGTSLVQGKNPGQCFKRFKARWGRDG